MPESTAVRTIATAKASIESFSRSALLVTVALTLSAGRDASQVNQ